MVDKEMLDAIGQMMDAKLEPINSRLDRMEADMNTRFDKVDEKLDFLETCINQAAKDAQASIKQHEKEWHSA